MAILPLLEKAARRALNARGVASRFVETPVGTVHAYDAPGRGELPTVVVLHGIGSSAAAYAPLIQKLRPKVRRVIAPEAPGHGNSGDPKGNFSPSSLFDALAEVIDASLEEPAIVYGCSLGGAMALSYALERPERVSGLFLASPAGASMSRDELATLLATFDLRSRADAGALMARLYHRAPWYTPLIAAELQRHFARPAITTLTRAASVEDLFTAEEVGSLRMPVHLVWGRSDRLLPASSLEFYRKSLPLGSVIEEPYGIGHCPHLDDPGALADQITRFAARVRDGATAG